MDYEKLTELLIELEVDDIQDAVKEALEKDGKDPFEVLAALTKGMDEVGRRYEAKEYYLTELVLAGETMKEAFEVLQPALDATDKSESKVKIILATGGVVGGLIMAFSIVIPELEEAVQHFKIYVAIAGVSVGLVSVQTILDIFDQFAKGNEAK